MEERKQITIPETPPIKDYQAALATFIEDLARKAHRLDLKASAVLENRKAGKNTESLLTALNYSHEAGALLSALSLLARACEKQAKKEARARAKKGGK